MNYWLMKTEPEVFSIDDLKREKQAHWEGIRNYQARNFMRDQMKLGDRVLFYHSNADPAGVAGLATVGRKSYPDFTAWDRKSEFFDPRSTPQNPVWHMVDVKFDRKFPHFVSLDQLRANHRLNGMIVLKKGMRLSIQPVREDHFKEVIKMGFSKA